jgi:hypothetical protein
MKVEVSEMRGENEIHSVLICPATGDGRNRGQTTEPSEFRLPPQPTPPCVPHLIRTAFVPLFVRRLVPRAFLV